MMELYCKHGFEDGLSYPQITLLHLGDKHLEDQATVDQNYSSPEYMAHNI